MQLCSDAAVQLCSHAAMQLRKGVTAGYLDSCTKYRTLPFPSLLFTADAVLL